MRKKTLVSLGLLVAFFLGMATLSEVAPDHGVLLDAMERGNIEQLRALLDRGANPNIRYTFQSGFLKRVRKARRFGWNEEPLLLFAVTHNEPDMAKLLLERGADPSVVDAYGNTALWHAVPLEDAELVKLMLEKGADPNVVMSSDGSTALAEAPKPPPDISPSERTDPEVQEMYRRLTSPEYRTRNQESIRLLQEAMK